MKELEKKYCKHVTPKTYKIDRETLDKVINKMSLNRPPGKTYNSLLVQKASFLKRQIDWALPNTYDGKETLPIWFTEGKTTLIIKNEHTNNVNNYRPIACLNLTDKMNTSCWKVFFTDLCNQNIIKPGEAGDKKRAIGLHWTATNKQRVMSEVKKKRRNLFTIWLNYKKAFDLVQH